MIENIIGVKCNSEREKTFRDVFRFDVVPVVEIEWLERWLEGHLVHYELFGYKMRLMDVDVLLSVISERKFKLVNHAGTVEKIPASRSYIKKQVV